MRYRAVDLGIPEADVLKIVAMNRSGQILANAHYLTGEDRCWLYDNGQLADLGNLGGMLCIATAMNDAGDVVGHSTTAEGYDHPFIYSQGRMSDITAAGVLNGTASVDDSGKAWAINGSGAVVGEAVSAGRTHAFLYQSGVLRDLDPMASVSVALGINDAGQITGWRVSPGHGATAYRYQNGVFEDIAAAGATSTIGRLINAAGDIAGTLSIPGQQHAFVFTQGQLSDLGTFGGSISGVSALNDLAQIAGSASVAAGTSHAMMTRDGIAVDLGSLATPPNDVSVARSINKVGQVVGSARRPEALDATAPDATTGFFSAGVGLYDLRTLLTPDSSADITDAVVINDAGQIAAVGLVGGRLHAYLLSPASIATELIVAPVIVRYGTHPQLSATLTAASTPLAQKTMTFALDGVNVGSAITDDNGVARLTLESETPSRGDHTISAAFAGDAQYAASSNTATLTVVKGHAHLIVIGGAFTYDGQPHRATVTATGELGEALTEGLAVSYALGATGNVAAPVGAGIYSANAEFAGDNNYEPATASAVITIARAPLTVTAKDATKLLGAANPVFDATYSGFVPGESPANLTGALAFVTPATAASPVGTYPITPSGLSSPNYEIGYVDGTLTVTYNICVNFDQTRAARLGSTIPIKLDLCTETGIGASSPAIVLKTATILKVSSAASSDVQDAGDANPDNDFRYLGPGYIFNLKTTALSTGTWDLVFTVTGDPLEHAVRFQVR